MVLLDSPLELSTEDSVREGSTRSRIGEEPPNRSIAGSHPPARPRLPDGRVHRRGPELLTRSPGRELAEEATGSRKFLGNPDCPFAHVQSTPAGLRPPDHCGGAAWPLGSQKQGLPRKVFRRSIAWLSDWLPPLRSAGYPRPAQDSLPAAGQALPGGLSTRRVPRKGFRGSIVTSHPPFPSFLPQCDRPKQPRQSLRASE
jgi:hypothetical protein